MSLRRLHKKFKQGRGNSRSAVRWFKRGGPKWISRRRRNKKG